MCVRERPLHPQELEAGVKECLAYDAATMQVMLQAVSTLTMMHLHGQAVKCFGFPSFCDQRATSRGIFQKHVAKLVTKVFDGFNATVLAYGQTGSGKTHTLSGGYVGGAEGAGEWDPGVLDLCAQKIFEMASDLTLGSADRLKIEVSGLELYNEELRDLACPGTESADIRIREVKGRNGNSTMVSGLVMEEVTTAEALSGFLRRAAEGRTTRSTKLNATSSRSHAIYTIYITQQRDANLNGIMRTPSHVKRTDIITSKLHLVDLAGSERVKRSGVTGQRLKETSSINTCLLALGNVICALSDSPHAPKHIPYRHNKLTRILQNALGGNSCTTLIACVSPAETDFEETMNTLKYAQRASKIKNTPVFNIIHKVESEMLHAPNGAMSYEALLDAFSDRLQATKENKPAAPNSARKRATDYDKTRRQNLGAQAPGARTRKALDFGERAPAAEGEAAAAAAGAAAAGAEAAPSAGEGGDGGGRGGGGSPTTPFRVTVQFAGVEDRVGIAAARSNEDYREIAKLLGTNSEIRRDHMSYLLARGARDGGALGCLMCTHGTTMISSCIFPYDEPEAVRGFGLAERTELWGLQIPSAEGGLDRLELSLGLLYAHATYALERGLKCGFCVPRPKLLAKWQEAGVPMRTVPGKLTLIYPMDAHDFTYYKSSTVAYFIVDEMFRALRALRAMDLE